MGFWMATLDNRNQSVLEAATLKKLINNMTNYYSQDDRAYSGISEIIFFGKTERILSCKIINKIDNYIAEYTKENIQNNIWTEQHIIQERTNL